MRFFFGRAMSNQCVVFALVLFGGARGVAQTPQDAAKPASQEKQAPAQDQDTKPVEKAPEPTPSAETPAKEASKPTPTFVKPQPPRQTAWAEKRAKAVKALELLARNPEAETAAQQALKGMIPRTSLIS